MLRSLCSRVKVELSEAGRGQRGFTLLEMVSAVAISTLGLASIHLTMGTALLGRVLTSGTVHKQHEGRMIVEWIGDRVREAGYGVLSSGLCQDKIPTTTYEPTATQLYVVANVDNTGPEIYGFRKTGNTINQQVLSCAGSLIDDQPLTSSSSAKVLSLIFAYYDASGVAVTNLTQADKIRSIRFITITATVRAVATHGPTDETWTTSIALRNP